MSEASGQAGGVSDAGSTTQVIYLYGFVPSGTRAPDLEGVGGRPVEILELGSFAAVIGRLPSEAFDAEAVRERLRDMDWVAEQGLQHEGVVNGFVDRTTILPARLLTLYSSTERLAREVAAREERILAAFQRLRGHREWDVKVAYEPQRAEERLAGRSPALAELDARMAESSPGTRYLLERKRARIVHDEIRRVAGELSDALLEALGRLAVQVKVLEAPAEAAELPVILNAALLVRQAREEPLQAEARSWADRLETAGLRVSFSGPWAPYRFLEGSDEARPDVALED